MDTSTPITIVNEKDEIKKIFPINEITEGQENDKNGELPSAKNKIGEIIALDNSFKIIFNKNSLNSLIQINFLAKNYRPKCDICKKLCNIDWYMLRKQEDNNESELICEVCFDSEKFPKDVYKKEDFEMANFFNIINPSESKIIDFQ